MELLNRRPETTGHVRRLTRVNHTVASLLAKDGHDDPANDVRRFVDRLAPARTVREL